MPIPLLFRLIPTGYLTCWFQFDSVFSYKPYSCSTDQSSCLHERSEMVFSFTS